MSRPPLAPIGYPTRDVLTELLECMPKLFCLTVSETLLLGTFTNSLLVRLLTLSDPCRNIHVVSEVARAGNR